MPRPGHQELQPEPHAAGVHRPAEGAAVAGPEWRQGVGLVQPGLGHPGQSALHPESQEC